jgi:hypothetical protein
MTAHDPVFVAELADGDRMPADYNDGCLAAHIDEAGLTDGTACRTD